MDYRTFGLWSNLVGWENAIVTPGQLGGIGLLLSVDGGEKKEETYVGLEYHRRKQSTFSFPASRSDHRNKTLRVLSLRVLQFALSNVPFMNKKSKEIIINILND